MHPGSGENAMALRSRHDDTGLDALNPEKLPARDATNFRRTLAARNGVEGANRHRLTAVEAAREAGDSWTIIGGAPDTSRQAAFQRFGKK